MVVADPSGLTSQDVDKKARIEVWDYTVNLIDEADSQASFDAALAANDVVYITEEVTHTTVGSKRTDTAVGLVNEERGLVPELGFGNASGSLSRDEIEIVDNTHSITDGYALGYTTITTSLQPFTYVNEGSAPGADVLGRTAQFGTIYKPSLLALETGAELWGAALPRAAACSCLGGTPGSTSTR